MAGATGRPSEEATGTGTENLALKMRLALAGIRKRFSNVKVASAAEFDAAMKKLQLAKEGKSGIVILDVREKEEFDVGHLPEAKWIDESKPMEQKVDEVCNLIASLNETGKCDKIDVYAYCSIGYRSSALLSNFMHRTRPDLPDNINFYDIQGGIFQWANDGRVMVDADSKSTKLVHPYNFVWGKLVQKQFRYKTSSGKEAN